MKKKIVGLIIVITLNNIDRTIAFVHMPEESGVKLIDKLPEDLNL